MGRLRQTGALIELEVAARDILHRLDSPRKRSIAVIRSLRTWFKLPIIVLSARDQATSSWKADGLVIDLAKRLVTRDGGLCASPPRNTTYSRRA